MKKLLLLLTACLLPLGVMAGTNELAPDGWVTEDSLIPAAEDIGAGPTGRYSVPVRDILAPHAGRTDNPHGVTAEQIGGTAAGISLFTADDVAAMRQILNVPDGVTNDYLQLINRPTLGDAAAKNTGTTAGTVSAGDHGHTNLPTTDQKAAFPAGASAANPLVASDDARLTDTRDPNAHQHPAAEVSDSGTAGRAAMTAETQADLRTAAGLGTMATATSGTGIGQHPPLVDVGACSDTQYTSQSTCQTGGGTWTAAAGWRIPGADFPAGGLTVDGVPVDPAGGTWAGITGKPSEFPPEPHSHAQSDISSLVARLDAVEAELAEVNDNLLLVGFPTLTINQASPLVVTDPDDTADLTGTYSDNGSIVSLTYSINGGATADITPLASPWSLSIPVASLTPNGSDTVQIVATDDTALPKTKNIEVQYQVADIAVAPNTKAFADTTVGESSATQQFTWTNSGLATGALGTIALSGTNADQFGLSGNTCGATLAPSSSCTANVVFSPTSAGAKTATVGDGTYSASLSGTGVVLANGFWGQNSTVGFATGNAGGSANQGICRTLPATTTGTVRYAHAYVVSATGNWNAGIYDNGGNLLRDGSLTYINTADARIDITLDSDLEITASTTYSVCLTSDDNYWQAKRKNTIGQNTTYNVPITANNTMPSTLPPGGTVSTNYEYNLWIDNLPTGGE